MHTARPRGRPIVAAIDDSALAVAVARRAARLAREHDRPLVLLTAVPFDLPVQTARDELLGKAHLLLAEAEAIAARVRPALRGLGHQPRLVVQPYRDRGGPRRAAQRIAGTLLRAAVEEDAHTLVLGLPDRLGQAGTSVIRRITHNAPLDMNLAFAVAQPPPGRRVSDDNPPEAAILLGPRLVPDPGDLVRISPAGRRLLADRAYLLRSISLPRQRQALATAGADLGERLGRYEHLVAELRRLQWLLRTAGSTLDRPEDRRRAELGDRVVLRSADGTVGTVLLVHPIEALFNPRGVAVDTALGRTLLGRRVGDLIKLPNHPRSALAGRSARIVSCRRQRLVPGQARRTRPRVLTGAG
jgi:transcription elongation GreA/GreB family factor